MKRNIVAVIPASGVGSRMNAPLPKQYLQIQGKTVLAHTLQPFLDEPLVTKVVVAVAEHDPFYAALAILSHPKIQLVFGGETRAYSVLNALNVLQESDWALVHDAARPCLKRSDLAKILQIESEHGGILAAPAVDTMKRAANNQILHTEDRSGLWHAFTPQFFNVGLLRAALNAAFHQGLTITDEASAMELAGFQPQLVEGRRDNLKITTPEDLALAEFYLMKGKEDD